MIDIVGGPAALAGFRGATELALGRAESAARSYAAGAAAMPGAASWDSGSAAAHALLGEFDRACALLTKALAEALERGLPQRLRRIEAIRLHYLAPWQNDPSVQEFDERLRTATTGRQSV